VSSNHVVPLKVYFTVFFSLLALTFITVQVAFVDLGVFNTVAAIGIACIKASLVVLYFMHVRYGTRLVWVIVAAAAVWFIILIGLTMGDYGSRAWLMLPGS